MTRILNEKAVPNIDRIIHELEQGVPLETMNRGQILAVLHTLRNNVKETRKPSQNHDYYSIIADYSWNLCFLLDSEKQRLHYISPSCERITGYHQKAFYNDPDLLAKIIHPDDHDRFKNSSNDDFVDEHFRITRKDGEVRWISFQQKQVTGVDGAIFGFRGDIRDITEYIRDREKLLETEQKLREIINYSTNLFYSHTPDNNVIFISPQSRNFFGLDPEDTIEKWTDTITDHPVNKKGIEATRQAIETGLPQPPYELQLKKNSGQTIWVEVHETPVVKNGEVVSIVGSLTDITDRKQAAEALQNSLNEKNVLLSEIHHRVKNNMAVITGLLMLDADGQDDPLIKNQLLDCVQRIRSMALVHNKLYQDNNFAEIEFGSYMEELTNSIQNHYGLSSGRIQTKITSDDILIDITKAIPCGLILNELVTNGFKHAFPERDDGTVYLTLLQNNGQIVLRYEDDGIGLPDYLIDPTLSDSSKNRIGITLIDGLTQQLRGTLTMNNQTGAFLEIRFPKS